MRPALSPGPAVNEANGNGEVLTVMDRALVAFGCFSCGYCVIQSVYLLFVVGKWMLASLGLKFRRRFSFALISWRPSWRPVVASKRARVASTYLRSIHRGPPLPPQRDHLSRPTVDR